MSALDEVMTVLESELEKALGKQWLEDNNQELSEHLNNVKQGYIENFPDNEEWKVKYLSYLEARYETIRR